MSTESALQTKRPYYAAAFFASIVLILTVLAHLASAQSYNSGSVIIDLSVLENTDPARQGSNLLMPSPNTTGRRTSLRPLLGSESTPARTEVLVLRAPASLAPPEITAAPTILIPPRAPAATSPPTLVTTSVVETQPSTEIPASTKPSEPTTEKQTNAKIRQSEAVRPVATAPLANEVTLTAGPLPREAVLLDIQETVSNTSEQTAALPKKEEFAHKAVLVFSEGQADLPAGAEANLRMLLNQARKDESWHIQLLAYASDTENNASQTRRLSLGRALSVRSFLMDQSVASTRIEVRALGNQNDGGEPDRVDAILIRR